MTTSSDPRGTQVDLDQSMVPAAKRAADKAEYERRKQEEEELKRQIEEERQRQLDQWGGVEDNLQAIPIQKILEFKMRAKQQEMQNTMSRTQMMDSLTQPAISGNTTMGTNLTGQLQKSVSMAQASA